MTTIPIPLGPFTEGVNLVDHPSTLSNEELAVCSNIRLGVRGEIQKRPGHDWFGSSPVKIDGDNKVNLLLRYYKADGTKETIAATNGHLYKINDNTGAATKILITAGDLTMEDTDLVDWMVYKDRLYIADGTKPQRYNTVNDVYAGSSTPGAPTTAGTTGGNLTLLNTYKYKVVFVSGINKDLGESVASLPATRALTGSNNQINLTDIPLGSAVEEVTARRIYRTSGNGEIYYFLTEINDNTTTVFNDTIADNALGEQLVDIMIPPADAKFVLLGHDERTYWFGMPGQNASIVWASDIGFPDRIPVTNFFSVSNNDGDKLTGAGLVPGGITFFKQTSIWLLRAYGYGLINIKPKDKKSSSGVGTTSPFSVVSTPIGLIFLSQRGEVYLFDGTNVTEIGRKVASEFSGLNATARANVVATYHDYRYIISYDYRGLKGYNWKTLEFDTRTGKWHGPHENGDFYTPSYYSVWDSVIDKGELCWGEAKAATGSYIYKRNPNSKYDRGEPFLGRVVSGKVPRANLGDIKTIKVFAFGRISQDAFITLKHTDEFNQLVTTDLSSAGSALSNVGVYDESQYRDLVGPPIVRFVYGGITEGVLEGSLPASRSKLPVYEIIDNKARELVITSIQLLAEALPLK